MFKLFGVITLAAIIGFSMAACGGDSDPGTDPSDGWGFWKAGAGYSYTAQAGKSYTYKFEAWTASGNRSLGIQYYNDNNDNVHKDTSISITSARTTYTITGETLPKGGERTLFFQCADKLGTFYVKVLEIKEVGSSSGGGSNPFVGKWIGTKDNGTAQIDCKETTWQYSWKTTIDFGTYTRSGNSASFKSNFGYTFGTATVSGNTMTVVPVDSGTFTLTKQE